MNTRIRKGVHGWTAETEVPIGDNRVLSILTMKRSDGSLTTTATVHRLETLRGMPMKSFAFGKDFHKAMLTEQVRCTEKAVAKQHADVLSHISTIKQRVAEHYGEEVSA